MAQAVEHFKSLREWSLTDYHRYVRITLGCGINLALCEMERRVVAEQLVLIRREYDADDNLKNAVVIDRFNFLSNYSFQFDRDDRVKVVTRRPEGLLPGGITHITKIDESDPKNPHVKIGPGRVMDGYYTVVELPPRPPAAQRRRLTKASKPKGGAKPIRKPSSAQAVRDAAIQDRLDNGVHPGSTVDWAGFYHDIRVRCGGFVGDPKDEKYKRGFSDVRIKHVTRKLIKP
jgi:hypothetical protein